MRKQSSIDVRSVRIVLVVVTVSILFLVTISRLVIIQIIDSPKYIKLAQNQYEKVVPLPPNRGLIYDRNNILLVSNTTLISFAADPVVVKEKLSNTVKVFSQIFNKPNSHYKSKLATKKRFVWLEKNVHPATAEKIIQKKIPGIIAANEPRRLFYHGGVAVQTIGIANFENIGKSGLEFQYNSILKGDSGYVIMQRDGRGGSHASIEYPRQEPINGNSLQLTIDLDYQSIVEDELKKGIERTKSDAGCVVMLNPNTGEVLAIANYPTFDPGLTRSFQQEALKNRAVTELYEPGSLFKAITVSAGISNNSISIDQKINAENGKYVVALNNGKTRTIEDTHPLYGSVSVADGLTQSSNIVMAKISNIIGAEQLYTHARSYGLGVPTNIEIPNEASGELKKPHTWSLTTLNNMSFGYELNASPLQMANMYAVIANGGLLMKPFIVKNILNEQGEIIEENEPKLVRRVISREVSESLKKMLQNVVDEGTGSGTKLTDLPIAGKTGTARKFVDGEYKKGFYNALFAGFYPVEKPEVVCVVLLENPKGGYYGGTTSAIIFRGIAERLHRNKGIFKSSEPIQLVENVEVAKPEKIESISSNQNIASSEKIIKSQSVNIVNGKNIQLPNVCGMTLRKALTVLKTNKLSVKFSGSGIVVQQTPVAGSEIPFGSTVSLQCSNSIAMLASTNNKKFTLAN